jgi:hypothetical protein
MNITSYNLILNENAEINIASGPYTSGKGRAHQFFSKLSAQLAGSDSVVETENLNEITSAVENVQKRLSKYYWYQVISWIPFTQANALSKLILSVRCRLDAKKQFLENEYREAQSNTTRPYDYFVASDRLMDVIKKSQEMKNVLVDEVWKKGYTSGEPYLSQEKISLKNRQALLFYSNENLSLDACLTKVERYLKENIACTIIDFARVFVVEFKSNHLVKIVKPELYAKNLIQNRYTNSRSNNPKQFQGAMNKRINEIFNYLLNTK